MANIIYENYPYTSGKRTDEKLNKGIFSLARRNKFYLKNIQGIINQTGIFNKDYHICVAKQMNKKNDDYKIVGFIIYEADTLWGRQRMLTTLQYWLVDEKMRNKSIGKALYAEMEKKTTEWGLSNFCLMYEKTNDKLRDLYTKLGYAFIPKYDGVENTTNKESDKHLLVYKIAFTGYIMPSGNNMMLIDTV